MTPAPLPIENDLLAALVTDDPPTWWRELELIELAPGTVLQEPGVALTHVYFPTHAIVSILCVTENGSFTEIAGIGREGLIGVSLLMGDHFDANRAVVQSGGYAYRLKATTAHRVFASSPPVMALLLRFVQALITQMAQTAVCNRYHSVHQQLCRWLLTRLDRLPDSSLSTTQEQIAHMLGVRREGVTEAALKLQRSGAIRYARGHIKVLHRHALEQCSCECYAVVRNEYERLLRPGPHPQPRLRR